METVGIIIPEITITKGFYTRPGAPEEPLEDGPAAKAIEADRMRACGGSKDLEASEDF